MSEDPDLATRLHRWIALAVAAVMTLDLGFIAFEGQWLNAVLILGIMALVLAPTALGERLTVKIPAEFQLLALVFSFSALFLGEVRDYYERLWWWHIALHASSGLLLGIAGFLLAYVLSENRRIEFHVHPRFVALFALLFAVSVGALWEIFEFAMDAAFGTTMQKPLPGDPSGLTDTMLDLIVNTLGALPISLYGWYYLMNPEKSFIERWIDKFIRRNPGLFRR